MMKLNGKLETNEKDDELEEIVTTNAPGSNGSFNIVTLFQVVAPHVRRHWHKVAFDMYVFRTKLDFKGSLPNQKPLLIVHMVFLSKLTLPKNCVLISDTLMLPLSIQSPCKQAGAPLKPLMLGCYDGIMTETSGRM